MKLTIIILLSLLIFPLNMEAQSYSFKNYDDHVSHINQLVIDDLSLAYLDVGQGPVVLLVHGIPTNSWLYRKMIGPLVDSGYRVIVPDMMGAGQSSKPKSTDLLSFESQSKYLITLLRQLNIKSCCLVVHDAGGPWSWNLLTHENHPIKSVVLLNTILYKEGFAPPIAPKSNGLTHRLIKWAYGNALISKLLIKTTLKNGIDMVKLNKDENEGYIRGMSKSGKQLAGTFFGSFSEIGNVAKLGQKALKEQNIPLLACWGQNDKILLAHKQFPLIMRDLNLKQKDAHLIALCNHFVQEEAPIILSTYITQFLSQLQ